MAPRFIYRRQCTYNTKSNKVRKLTTPGGKFAISYQKKQVKPTVCGESGCTARLGGIKRMRPAEFHRSKQRDRKVYRPYGGHLCGKCVRQRIIRAFLIEEVKLVKKVVNQEKKGTEDKAQAKPQAAQAKGQEKKEATKAKKPQQKGKK